jgi:hypothetical protein
MKRLLAAMLFAAWLPAVGHAQDAQIVAVCGTAPPPYNSPGSVLPLTMDVNGKLCSNASGGGGTPGGANTNVQFNSTGTFGGDSGFTYAGAGGAVTATGSFAAPVISPGTKLVISGATQLFALTAGSFDQENATSAQSFHVYNTFTSATNYERGTFDWQNVANVLSIGTEKGSGGGSVRNMQFTIGGVNQMDFGVTNAGIWSMPGSLKLANLISGGSVPVDGGGSCLASSFAGGATAGTFSAAVCAAGTIAITFAFTAPTGWVCNARDRTTPADSVNQTASTTTKATFTATTVASDVIQYSCTAY